MLIGAHVSTAGGLHKAVERGVERGCDAIQIFSQSPRAWRPTAHSEADFAAFREAFDASGLGSVVIHAIYLINPASDDPELRRKSVTALTGSLRVGDAIGAGGVVLHPGAPKLAPPKQAMKRVGAVIREALAESERCPLLLEDTAGAADLLGRDIAELARMIELGGGGERLGVCLDSCHLLASGYEVRKPQPLAELLDELDREVGLERLCCLHLNDSAMPLGSNRDRHANLGDGELGERGIANFLSEPRFDGLPALLEVPGTNRQGPDAEQIAIARKLRKRGIRNRRARARRARAGQTP